MIATEEWYEYQKQYLKYGIEMRPEEERVSRRQKREEEKKARLSREMILNIGSDHRVLVTLIAICVVCLIMVVVFTSYAAKVTYDINAIKAENDVISGEIEDLDVQMLSSSTITYIEGQAKDRLGMKSPDENHCVFLSEGDVPEKGFADIMQEKAYN